MENTWFMHPALKDMDPIKLQVLTELAENTSGKPLTQAAGYLIKANKTLNAAGLSFTPQENILLMEILTKDMTETEKEELERIQTFLKQYKK